MGMWSVKDATLKSILNMENMFEGGLKTEYGLDILSSIAKDRPEAYTNEILDILDDLSKMNFRELNEKNQTYQRNEKQIIDVMYEVANNVVRNALHSVSTYDDNNPSMKRYKTIADRTYDIMRRMEENNKRYVDYEGISRYNFMESYTNNTVPTQKAIIARNKEGIRERLKKLQDKKEEIFYETEGGKWVDKNEKIYTADDLIFSDKDYLPKAHLSLENGLTISVTDYKRQSKYGIGVKEPSDLCDEFKEVYGKDELNKVMKEIQKLSAHAVKSIENFTSMWRYGYNSEDEIIEARNDMKRENIPLSIFSYEDEPDVLSGTVIADKIADGMRNGIITEPVTPKKGKELSDNVKRKYVVDKIQSGKY